MENWIGPERISGIIILQFVAEAAGNGWARLSTEPAVKDIQREDRKIAALLPKFSVKVAESKWQKTCFDWSASPEVVM